MQNPGFLIFKLLLKLYDMSRILLDRVFCLKLLTLTVQAFSDRSIAIYIVLFGSTLVSLKSKKQSRVSRSSSEAIYRAMASKASEVTWLVRLLTELGVND